MAPVKIIFPWAGHKDAREMDFDPAFPCTYCNEPVGSPSMGGTAVCPSCDCGYNRDGSRWTYQQTQERFANYRRRMSEQTDAPEIKKYLASREPSDDRK